MLSSEKNIGHIEVLIEKLKRFIELKGEYLKFDAVEKLVKLFTALVTAFILLILFLVFLFYLTSAAASWMTPAIGAAGSYLIIAGFYLLLIILFIAFKKAWIERPLLRFLVDLFLDKRL